MECEKKGFRFYRQGKELTDQFYIEGDYNVPDSKSDVKTVIMSNTQLSDLTMTVVENYIRVSGNMDFGILYVADEEEMRMNSVKGRMPFEEMIYMEETALQALFVKSAQAELTVNVINSRKLSLKATAELHILSDGEEDVYITVNAQEGKDAPGESKAASETLYKKYETRELLGIRMVKKDTYRMKEEVTIDGTKESIGNILWTEVLKRRTDTRLEQDTLKIQGELLLFVFYEALDGKPDWSLHVIPYEGEIECAGVTEDMYHQAYISLSNVSLEPGMDEDGELRRLGLEATLNIRVLVFEEEKVDILSDMYSLEKNCIPEYAQLEGDRLLMQNHSKCKLTEQLTLPEIKEDILQICYSSGQIQVDSMTCEAQGIRMEGVLHVKFLYVRTDDRMPFAVWQGMVPFSHLLESNEVNPEMRFDVTYATEQLGIGLLGNGEIEVKAVLAFDTFIRGSEKICTVESIAEEPLDFKELEKGPGIIGYIVKDGDDLWSLAKHFHTTKDGIMEVNGMDSEELKCGDKLLIFRENISIL